MINFEDFDSNSLKIYQKHCHLLHQIHHNKKIDDYENVYSVNPLYLIIGKVDGFIKEKNENKYIVFDSTNENKELLKKYTELAGGIKNEVEK